MRSSHACMLQVVVVLLCCWLGVSASTNSTSKSLSGTSEATVSQSRSLSDALSLSLSHSVSIVSTSLSVSGDDSTTRTLSVSPSPSESETHSLTSSRSRNTGSPTPTGTLSTSPSAMGVSMSDSATLSPTRSLTPRTQSMLPTETMNSVSPSPTRSYTALFSISGSGSGQPTRSLSASLSKSASPSPALTVSDSRSISSSISDDMASHSRSVSATQTPTLSESASQSLSKESKSLSKNRRHQASHSMTASLSYVSSVTNSPSGEPSASRSASPTAAASMSLDSSTLSLSGSVENSNSSSNDPTMSTSKSATMQKGRKVSFSLVPTDTQSYSYEPSLSETRSYGSAPQSRSQTATVSSTLSMSTVPTVTGSAGTPTSSPTNVRSLSASPLSSLTHTIGELSPTLSITPTSSRSSSVSASKGTPSVSSTSSAIGSGSYSLSTPRSSATQTQPDTSTAALQRTESPSPSVSLYPSATRSSTLSKSLSFSPDASVTESLSAAARSHTNSISGVPTLSSSPSLSETPSRSATLSQTPTDVTVTRNREHWKVSRTMSGTPSSTISTTSSTSMSSFPSATHSLSASSSQLHSDSNSITASIDTGTRRRTRHSQSWSLSESVTQELSDSLTASESSTIEHTASDSVSSSASDTGQATESLLRSASTSVTHEPPSLSVSPSSTQTDSEDRSISARSMTFSSLPTRSTSASTSLSESRRRGRRLHEISLTQRPTRTNELSSRTNSHSPSLSPSATTQQSASRSPSHSYTVSVSSSQEQSDSVTVRRTLSVSAPLTASPHRGSRSHSPSISNSEGTASAQLSSDVTNVITRLTATKTKASRSHSRGTRSSSVPSSVSETSTLMLSLTPTKSATRTMTPSLSAVQASYTDTLTVSSSLSVTVSPGVTISNRSASFTVTAEIPSVSSSSSCTQQVSASPTRNASLSRQSVTSSVTQFDTFTMRRGATPSSSPTAQGQSPSPSRSPTPAVTQTPSRSVTVTMTTVETSSRTLSSTGDRTNTPTLLVTRSQSTAVSNTTSTTSTKVHSPTASPANEVTISKTFTDTLSPTPFMSNTQSPSSTVTFRLSESLVTATLTASLSQQLSPTRSPSRQRTPTQRLLPTASAAETKSRTVVVTLSRPSPTLSSTDSATVTVSVSQGASRTQSLDTPTPSSMSHSDSRSLALVETHTDSLSAAPSASQSLTLSVTSPRTTVTLTLNATASKSPTEEVSSSKSSTPTTSLSDDPTATRTASSSASGTVLSTVTMIASADATASRTSELSRSSLAAPTQTKSMVVTQTADVTVEQTLSSSLTAPPSTSLSQTRSLNRSATDAHYSHTTSGSQFVSLSGTFSQPVSFSTSVTLSKTMTLRLTVSPPHTPTREATPDTSMSFETHSRSYSRTRSRSGSPSPTTSDSPTPSDSDTFVFTTSLTIEITQRTLQPSASYETPSRTTSSTSEVTATYTTTTSFSDSGTDDVTLTASDSNSKQTAQPSASETSSSSTTKSATQTHSIDSMLSAIAEVRSPQVPVVHDQFILALMNVPTLSANDVAYAVLRNASSTNERATANSCARRVALFHQGNWNAVPLERIGVVRESRVVQPSLRNVSVATLLLAGVGRSTGWFDLCYFSGIRLEWTWWNVTLMLGPKFRPATYVFPRGRLNVSASFRLTIGVWGANATRDHMLLVHRALRNTSQPTSVCPMATPDEVLSRAPLGTHWLTAGPSATNASFAASGSVLMAGDFVLCYYGFPYRQYRVALPLLRIAGVPQRLATTSLSSLGSLVAFQTATVTIIGQGLGAFDQIFMTSGGRCDDTRISSSVVVVRLAATTPALASSTSVFAIQTALVYSIQVRFPFDVATICFKSNVSTYFSSMLTLAVDDNAAASVRPDSAFDGGNSSSRFLQYARGATISLVDIIPRPNATLHWATDSAAICLGNVTDCSCMTTGAVQLFRRPAHPRDPWTLPSVSMVDTAAAEEIWSLCYATNASRPEKLRPLQLYRITAFPTVPQVFPSAEILKPFEFVVMSFNVTASNTVVRLFAQGAAVAGCPSERAIPNTVASISSKAVTNADGVSRIQVAVVPFKVTPLEVCIFHALYNDTLISSTLMVSASTPTAFSPTRFVVNQSTLVTFFPADASLFNFATTAATVALCSNVSGTQYVKLLIDEVVDATTLRLRFTNITDDGGATVAASVLCFVDPVNKTALPIPQLATFSVTSQMISSAFAVSTASGVPRVLNSAVVAQPGETIFPSTYATTVVVTVRGIALYPAKDLVIAACSGVRTLQTSILTTSTSVAVTSGAAFDITTTVVQISSTVSGNITLCASFGQHRLSGTFVELRRDPLAAASSSNPPLFVLFDTRVVAAQQLPFTPHSVQLDPIEPFWLLTANSSDSAAAFHAVRVVQLVSGFDDICTNPLAVDLVAAASTSGTVWKYSVAATATFVRGNVTLCYRSQSLQWYSVQSFLPASSFFMQAVPLPSSVVASDTDTGSSTMFATCSSTIALSGYQLDASLDEFYFYYTSSTSPSQEICRPKSDPSTEEASVAAVVRDTTDRSRLVNISLRLAAQQTGRIALCVALGQSSQASITVSSVLLGIHTIGNPVNVTSMAGRTVISTVCRSQRALAAQTSVRYNISVRFSSSASFLLLDAPLNTPTFVMPHAPREAFTIRYAVVLANSGALLSSIDSTTIPRSAPSATSQRLSYCASFNASANGADVASSTQFAFASSVVLMSNFVAADCGAFQRDGTLNGTNGGQAAVTAVQRMLDVQPSLAWDGGYLYPLMAAVVTSSLRTGSGSTGTSIAEATTTFASLFAVTDPFAEMQSLGMSPAVVVTNHIRLLAAATEFSSASMDPASAAILAPLIVSRFQALASISCAAQPSSNTSSSSEAYSSGGVTLATSKLATRSEKAEIQLGSSVAIELPRGGPATGGSSCVSVVSMPNCIPNGIPPATSQRRLLNAQATPTLLEFNVSTVVVFSDAPITSAFISILNSPYVRVDAFDAYRFLDANISSPTLTSVSGGSWERLSTVTYAFDASKRQLDLDVQLPTTPIAVSYLMLSGIAVGIYPDAILAKRQAAVPEVRQSILIAVIAVVGCHIVGVIAGVCYDRYSASRRYNKSKELLFGVSSPVPSWMQLHRYVCVLTTNAVSLTPEEYQKVRNEASGGDTASNEQSAVTHDHTLHPLAVVATVSKVHAIAMYWYSLLLMTAFVNREDVASQLPYLWDDFVLQGGAAAVLARPFAAWARVAFLRHSQDKPSLIASVAAVATAVVAGGASSLSMQSIMIVTIAMGISVYALSLLLWHHKGAGPASLQAKSKKASPSSNAWRWSLHHLVDVPFPVQAVSVLLLLVAFVLCAALLCLAPYFMDKDVVFEYQPSASTVTTSAKFPYFGRGNPYLLPSADAYTPDTSLFWKSFVLGLVLDATVVEAFVICALLAFMRTVRWWRIGRFTSITHAQQLLRKGSGKSFIRHAPTGGAERGGGDLMEMSHRSDVESVDEQFVDVFSGSPTSHEDREPYWNDSKQKYDSRKRAAHTPFSTSSKARSDGYATPQKAKTTFHTDAVGGGLIEEITDFDSELDRTFVSVDAEGIGDNDPFATPAPESHQSWRRSFRTRPPSVHSPEFGEFVAEEYVDAPPAVAASTTTKQRHLVAPTARGLHEERNPLRPEEVWGWNEPQRQPYHLDHRPSMRSNTSLRLSQDSRRRASAAVQDDDLYDDETWQ